MSDRDLTGSRSGSGNLPGSSGSSGSGGGSGMGAGSGGMSGSGTIGGSSTAGTSATGGSTSASSSGMSSGGTGSIGSGSGAGSTAAGGSGIAQSATEAVDTVKEHLADAGSRASTIASQGIEGAATGLSKAAELLRGRGEAAGGVPTDVVADKLDSASRYLHSGGGQLIGDLEAMVRRNPTQALLVAAGIGFLLSKIGK